MIHQVPNHFALVQIVRDFRAGLLDGELAADVGVIRFDFARNETSSFRITAAPASLWSGFRASVALGFHHVVTGFDHVLFRITLLIVAPLRATRGAMVTVPGLGVRGAPLFGHQCGFYSWAFRRATSRSVQARACPACGDRSSHCCIDRDCRDSCNPPAVRWT